MRTLRPTRESYLGFLLFVLAVLLNGQPIAAEESNSDRIAPPPKPVTETAPLEKRSYIKNLEILATHFHNTVRGGKIQMMALGEHRYLVQSRAIPAEGTGGGSRHGGIDYVGQIIDVTDALHPKVVADDTWPDAFQIQVAWNDKAKKWVAITNESVFPPQKPGFRGVKLYDITDPTSPKLISRFSTDGGDPTREKQDSMGSHRNYYDGGRYAYLTAMPSSDFILDPTFETYTWGGIQGGFEIVDVLDIAKPQLTAEWHIPGQRVDEADERSNWRSAGDLGATNFLHGPVYVPQRVEDGGSLGYGPWGSLGMVITDISDPQNPKMVSQWAPEEYVAGGMPFHTVDVARLNRGFVITNPESFMSHCRESWHDSYVIDVSDPAHPKKRAVLPIPVPPKEAPYKSFCERYGRFGTHNPPHIKAPGKPDPDFTCYTYFAAGLQCYDIKDPSNPKISAYFVPEQGTDDSEIEANPGPMGKSIRTADNVFIEWDRKLIWLATDSGLYLLSAPALGTPETGAMRVSEWVFPSINKGHP